MDLTVFKEKNDRKNGIGSDIFEYRNLTDFEKILFLEHNVKELIELLKKKDNHIKELDAQFDRIILEYDETRQVKALKSQVTQNLAIIKKYKTLYLEQLNK